MTEPRRTAKTTAAPAIALFEFPQFELPKFELPKFELPNVEMPAALRDIAEQGIAQAKTAYERAKAAAEQATRDALLSVLAELQRMLAATDASDIPA